MTGNRLKNTLIILIMSVIFSSCEDLSDVEQILPGKWKLVEYSYSIGGPQIHKEVTDGHEIIFSNDNTFSSNANPACEGGTYQINESGSELVLTYDCDKIQTNISNITFTSANEFVLIPKSPACVEGCSYKYQKQ
ncbi:MAG: lipocalin family protein [Bacteroidota bacterium]